MKKLSELKKDSILGWAFGLGLLAYFLVGAFIRLYLDLHNDEPLWLESVMLTTVGGLFFSHWGIFGLLASKKRWAQTTRLDYRVGAVFLFLFYGLLPLFFGLYILWIALGNFIELL